MSSSQALTVINPLGSVSPPAETISLERTDPEALRQMVIAWAGDRAGARSEEFFFAVIRNPNTRRAYHRACASFIRWCAWRGLALQDVRGVDVGGYLDELGRHVAVPTVKQQLAALKHWFDFMVTGHILNVSPAASVRGPRYSQEHGKTPVVARDEARALFESIDASTLTGARDRALIAAMLFCFARIGAVVKMRVRDYRGVGTARVELQLHEKGGKDHRVPAHHRVVEALDSYLALAMLDGKPLADQPDAPLFQSIPRHSARLSGFALVERNALHMVKRRIMAAGLPPDISNHSFRATGITLHQDAGGELEAARQLAAHSSVKTTQLYNRSGNKKRRDEVERVQL